MGGGWNWAEGLSGLDRFWLNGPLRGRALSQPPATMAPRGRDGGPGCRCPGPASCKAPATCCKRPRSPGPARAVCPKGGVTKTRCLACAGLAQLGRARKRPAAAKAKGKGKAKAAPKVAAAPKAHAALLAAVPKAAAGMAAPKAAAAPVALAASAAVQQAVAAAVAQPASLTDAVARELTAALERKTAVAIALTRTLGTRALVAPPTAAASSSSPPAALGFPPECPARLKPLRVALIVALAAPAPTSAGGVLRAAGLRESCSNAWAQLRAVVVAFQPNQAARVANLELVRPGEQGGRALSDAGRATAEMWARYGRGQMRTVSLTRDVRAVTVVSHVARYLLADEALRQRYQVRLLEDAAALQ